MGELRSYPKPLATIRNCIREGALGEPTVLPSHLDLEQVLQTPVLVCAIGHRTLNDEGEPLRGEL